MRKSGHHGARVTGPIDPARQPGKAAAFDRVVQGKMGLVGWMNGRDLSGAAGSAAQRAAAMEDMARRALQGRDLPTAQDLVSGAISHRESVLSPGGRQKLQKELHGGAPPDLEPHSDPVVQRHLRLHQRAMGNLRSVGQAMSDVESAFFHEARKIDGDWTPEGGARKR